MLTRTEVIETVRAFLRTDVLKDGNATLEEEEPLLSGGRITSFDLVTLSAFLEERFLVRVPDALVSREHLDTLALIAGLVLSLKGEGEPVEARAGSGPDPLARALPSFRRRPLVLLLGILVALGLAELLARALVPSAERACAIEPRRVAYLSLSIPRLLLRHEVALRPKAPDEVRITFQGQSGVHGQLAPETTCVAAAGRILAARDPSVRTYNLAILGHVLVKDACVLEAQLPYAPDVVVLSLGTNHFSRFWVKQPGTYAAYNRPLFRAFVERVPWARSSPELAGLDAITADLETRLGYRAWRPLEERSTLLSEHLLLRQALLDGLWPSAPLATARSRSFVEGALRVYAGKKLAEVPRQMFEAFDPRPAVLLEAIVDRARAAGVEVLLFREPVSRFEGNPPGRLFDDGDLARIRATLEDVARKKAIPLVDAQDLLDQDEFTDSEHHWTRAAHEKLGQALARGLAPLVERVKAHRGR